MAFTRVAVVPLKHGANRLVELDAAAFVDPANIKLRKFHSKTQPPGVFAILRLLRIQNHPCWH